MSKIIVSAFFVIFCYAQIFGGTVETFNLKNGIKVIYKKTDSVNIVSLKFYSPVSILNEDIAKAGVTSLLYSVMNKSTKKRDVNTLAEDIENLGSSINSEVEYDYSGFSLTAMTENFDKTLDILSDIITNPVFDEKELEKEKILNAEIIKSRQDSINKTADDKFIADFYGNSHPYSYARYGKIETLKHISQKDLIDAYNKIYFSKGIIITVAGNISKQKLKKALEKYFSSIKLDNEIVRPNIAPVVNIKNKDIEVASKFNQAFIIYAYEAPNLYSNDFVTLKLINSILGGRMTGRLFVELREKLGLAYEVNSSYPTRIDKSYFEIYIGLDKKNIDVAKQGIETIINDLCNIPVAEQELQDTKNFIRGIYLLDHQTIEKQAYYLGVREILGLGYEYDDKYISLLDKVSSKDIIDVANRYFNSMPYKLILVPGDGGSTK